MVKAVDHDIVSGTATTGWETVKGSIKGGIVPIVLGALLLGAAAYVGVAMFTGGVVGGTLSGVGSWFAGLSVAGKTGVIAATLGAAVGAVYAPIGAGIGGLLGLFKGGHRVAQEKTKYAEKSENHEITQAVRMQYAAQVGAQQGFMVGRQQGRQEAIDEQLYAERMEGMKEKMIPAPQKSFTASIDAERKAAALAPKQLGS